MRLVDCMPAWATIAGFDDAFWPEPGETHYRQTVPEVGVACAIECEGRLEPSVATWLLYRWWDLESNGWNTIRDIEQTAVVLAQLEHVHQPVRQLFTALPLRVVCVPELLALPPQTKNIGFWKDPFGRMFEPAVRGADHYTFGPYHVFDRNMEGEAGMWLICHEADSTISALLGCDWTGSERYFYAGNGRLTPADAAHLRAIAY